MTGQAQGHERQDHGDTITNQAGSGVPWHCCELVRHAPYNASIASEHIPRLTPAWWGETIVGCCSLPPRCEPTQVLSSPGWPDDDGTVLSLCNLRASVSVLEELCTQHPLGKPAPQGIVRKMQRLVRVTRYPSRPPITNPSQRWDEQVTDAQSVS